MGPSGQARHTTVQRRASPAFCRPIRDPRPSWGEQGGHALFVAQTCFCVFCKEPKSSNFTSANPQCILLLIAVVVQYWSDTLYHLFVWETVTLENLEGPSRNFRVLNTAQPAVIGSWQGSQLRPTCQHPNQLTYSTHPGKCQRRSESVCHFFPSFFLQVRFFCIFDLFFISVRHHAQAHSSRGTSVGVGGGGCQPQAEF